MVATSKRQATIELNKLQQVKRHIAKMEKSFDSDLSALLSKCNEMISEQTESLKRQQELLGGAKPDLQILDAVTKIGCALTEARLSLGWSHSDFAAKVGLTRQQVCRYERQNYASIKLAKAAEIVQIVNPLLTRSANLGQQK